MERQFSWGEYYQEMIYGIQFMQEEEPPASLTPNLCKICEIACCNILYLPCRHCVVCHECVIKYDNCIRCNKEIASYIKILL